MQETPGEESIEGGGQRDRQTETKIDRGAEIGKETHREKETERRTE